LSPRAHRSDRDDQGHVTVGQQLNQPTSAVVAIGYRMSVADADGQNMAIDGCQF
jgi:hypothetical protein